MIEQSEFCLMSIVKSVQTNQGEQSLNIFCYVTLFSERKQKHITHTTLKKGVVILLYKVHTTGTVVTLKILGMMYFVKFSYILNHR